VVVDRGEGKVAVTMDTASLQEMRGRCKLCKVEVDGGRVGDGKTMQVQVISELPIGLVKVSERATQLVVSFYQPELDLANGQEENLTSQKVKEVVPRYMAISDLTYDQNSRVELSRDPVKSNVYYL